MRVFFEHGVLSEKARFTDFKQLIDLLAERATQFPDNRLKEKLLRMLHKYDDLVDLQKKLPTFPKKLSAKANWRNALSKVKMVLRLSLCVKSTELKGLNRSYIPALPERQVILDKYAILDAINRLSGDYRESGRWLMHHMSILTFEELCRSIRESCDKIREEILTWDNYALLVITGKSQEWAADIGIRYLPQHKLPDEILSVGNHMIDAWGIGLLFPAIAKAKSNHFIMFDDVTYSGTQLRGYLSGLLEDLKRENHVFDETKHIYFIYGASPKSQDWKSTIESVDFESHNVHVHFISSYSFENIHDLMNRENLADEMRKKIEILVGNTHRPLLTTEWKTPDFMSIPDFVSEGIEPSQARGEFSKYKYDATPIKKVTRPYDQKAN